MRIRANANVDAYEDADANAGRTQMWMRICRNDIADAEGHMWKCEYQCKRDRE
jgi:hypothetical protein